ncbi:hypothetical protein MAR_030676 [Mya arenaria]|uniref:NAD(P)(+)--arginine ADP-ribosyltransferase n=1 Tax=Mya arenaria TaxID=6604 RepID=A0ABY7F378_MYAAR|nr:uncharacterized protein LOC128206292 [Mya arenaria]WAR16082.1 hypothetical protein MAR_030676 [Mya arenaria]
MMVNVLFQVFGILLCTSCLVEGVSYADEVRNLFERHFTNKDNECWSTTGADENTNDKGMAIALVNVYTQNCINYNNNPDNRQFYWQLNAKLRDQTNEQIWRDTEKLLNKALEMLGAKTWDLVFRASHCTDIKKGYILKNYDFWSTSLNASASANFLDENKIFFKIVTSPGGTEISEYSNFTDEKEVLLQSNSELYVQEYITDEQGIDAKKKKVGLPKSKKMKAFAVVTGNIPARASRSGLRSGFCGIVRGSTADASPSKSGCCTIL